MPIHLAMKFVSDIAEKGVNIHLRVEDSRKRKWYGKKTKGKDQGAGSIKRDCKIWEDFLTTLKEVSKGKITFEMLHPIKGGTKIDATLFRKITGIQKRTNEHGRDAYMLIHNFTPNKTRRPIVPPNILQHQ